MKTHRMQYHDVHEADDSRRTMNNGFGELRYAERTRETRRLRSAGAGGVRSGS